MKKMTLSALLLGFYAMGCNGYGTQEVACVPERVTVHEEAALPNACFWTAQSEGYDGGEGWRLDEAKQVVRVEPKREKAPKKAPKKEKSDNKEGCIDINTADAATLAKLPGVGKARAEAIIAARNRRPFSSPRSVTRVKGIGAKAYKKMAGYLCGQK